MKIVTLADISLISSTIAADLYGGSATADGKWTAAKAAALDYDTGDEIYYAEVEPHRVYTSLVDNNTATPGTDTTKWTNNGATDRWLMFDEFMETQSAYDEEFTVEIDASATNYVSLFRMVAKEVTLTLFTNAQLIADGDCAADSFDKGTGWTHDAADDEYDCDGTQTADSNLSQATITTTAIKYMIKFTVKNYSAGNIAGVAGGTSGTDVAADGDYAQVITAGASGIAGVVADLDFVGSVTDISVQTVPKSETIDLDGSIIFDWYSYLLATQEYKETLKWEFPRYTASTLRATITYFSGSDAKVGIMPIGYGVELGGTNFESEIGFIDYSIKDTDSDFGYTYLNEGSYADDGKFKVWIQNTRLDAVKRLLVANRGKATVLDFNNSKTDYESFVYYCFIGQNRTSVHSNPQSRLTIEATGLI